MREEKLEQAAIDLTIPILLIRGKLSDVVSPEGVKDFLAKVPQGRVRRTVRRGTHRRRRRQRRVLRSRRAVRQPVTVGFNFLEAPELPAPQVSEAQAEDILAAHYGLRARATSLGSQQDKNFVVTVDGEILGVLKIANPAFNATEIEAQDLAAENDRRGRAVAADRGAAAEPCWPKVHGPHRFDGRDRLCAACCVSCPAGRCSDSGYLSPTAVAGLGEVAGRVSRALEGFRHPGLDRVLQWDLRYGTDVVAELISHVADPLHRARVDAAATEAWSRIAPLVDDLPRQAVHLDLTDANVVVARRRGQLGSSGRGHRLRRPVRQLGRVRTGDHGVVGAGPPRY